MEIGWANGGGTTMWPMALVLLYVGGRGLFLLAISLATER